MYIYFIYIIYKAFQNKPDDSLYRQSYREDLKYMYIRDPTGNSLCNDKHSIYIPSYILRLCKYQIGSQIKFIRIHVVYTIALHFTLYSLL